MDIRTRVTAIVAVAAVIDLVILAVVVIVPGHERPGGLALLALLVSGAAYGWASLLLRAAPSGEGR